MIAAYNTLIAYTERYILARDLSPDYASSIRARVVAFTAWCGADIDVGSLTCELVNEWLAHLTESGISPWTVQGYRQAVLAVWNEAFQAGDNDYPPLRLRKIKKPRLVVEAYTHEEIRELLATAAKLLGRHLDGNWKRDFWQAAIHVAYCCGPRRGDLLKLTKPPADILVFVQHKTGYPNTVRLSADAMDFCARLKGERLLPWPYNLDCFTRTFKRLRGLSGVKRGTFRWIRRSAGSYADKRRRGDGPRLLGHRCEHIFHQFYEDTGITQEPSQSPPL